MIYSLCDISHVALQPWLRAGFDCTAIDIETNINDDGITHITSDIRHITELKDAQFVCAFPPCTNLTNSGARWFANKGQSVMDESVRLVLHCAKLIIDSGAPGFIENPIGVLSTHWKKPDCIVDPCDFDALTTDDENFTKGTCLWLFNGCKPPKKHPTGIECRPLYVRDLGSMNRVRIASRTPRGLANAMFLSNFDYGH